MKSKRWTDEEKEEKILDLFVDGCESWLALGIFRLNLTILSHLVEDWIDPLNPPEGLESEEGHNGHSHGPDGRH